ncbi:MAG: hypothetical protein HFE77_01395 [Clostridiales bacterium]|nr:hypothetical protein [Clostridiales bacterium]
MTPYEMIQSYMERRFYPDQYRQFICANHLDMFFQEAGNGIKKDAKIRVCMMESVLLYLVDLLDSAGIQTIHFKGITLARLLYAEPEKRCCNDLDFYIDSKNYSNALNLLLSNGFLIQTEFDGHHIVLNYHDVSVEMHTTFFHPNDKISFTVHTKYLQQIVIKGRTLIIFSPTYQFVFLLLHYFVHAKKGGKYTNNELLFQQYQIRPVIGINKLLDIALLVEKYGEKIEWNQCVSELMPVKNCIEFQLVLREILDVFPNMLPNEFLLNIYLQDEIVDNNFSCFNRFISDCNHRFDSILADIYEHHDQAFPCSNTKPIKYRFFVDEYDADKPHSYVISGIAPSSREDLSFCFDFWIQDKKLWFSLEVTDDVLNFLSEGIFPNDYESCGYCDGFLLCIASGEPRYDFHKIHVFLTQDHEKRYLSVYDIGNDDIVPLNDITESCLDCRAGGYAARIGIPLQYLHLDANHGVFYFNVMVNDSDDEKGCEKVLAYDSLPTAWNDCRTYPCAKYNF